MHIELVSPTANSLQGSHNPLSYLKKLFLIKRTGCARGCSARDKWPERPQMPLHGMMNESEVSRTRETKSSDVL